MKLNRPLLIIVSLCISILIWLNLNLYKSHTSSLDLPIQYLNRSASSNNITYPNSLKVKVNGLGINILRLHFSNISVYYDCKNVLTNNEVIDADNFQIELPPSLNLDIIEILPVSENKTNLELLSSVVVPINLVFENKEAEELYLSKKFQLSPEKIEVKGASNLLSSLNVISSQIVTAKMLSRDRVKVRLSAPNPKIMLSNNEVYLSRNGAFYATRVFSKVTIKSKPNDTIFPSELTIWIKGTSSALAFIRATDFEITLIEEEHGKYSCRVTVPEDIELLDYSPKTVTRIQK